MHTAADMRQAPVPEKRPLVQADPNLSGHICSSHRIDGVRNICFGSGVCRQAKMLGIVYGD
jgi:hypothetical protein